MTYEFRRSFTDEERHRIMGALDDVGGRENAVLASSWSIFRREVDGSHHFFAVATDRRAVDGERSSYYGRNLDRLVSAIQAENAA